MLTESIEHLNYFGDNGRAMSIENTFHTISCDHPYCDRCISYQVLGINDLKARGWAVKFDKPLSLTEMGELKNMRHYCPHHLTDAE